MYLTILSVSACLSCLLLPGPGLLQLLSHSTLQITVLYLNTVTTADTVQCDLVWPAAPAPHWLHQCWDTPHCYTDPRSLWPSVQHIVTNNRWSGSLTAFSSSLPTTIISHQLMSLSQTFPILMIKPRWKYNLSFSTAQLVDDSVRNIFTAIHVWCSCVSEPVLLSWARYYAAMIVTLYCRLSQLQPTWELCTLINTWL